ncbi:MAG: exodeoxyribonuclease VII small subunit [Verrucomicrobiae bacterium]|nr:exodeoxyribonuclease VII small subunit [Verrucomicrobiae bacterium]
MESGDLTLEQLLSRFEEGARLARVCQTQLEAAEVRVQQLEQSLSGSLTPRPVAVPGEDADA